MFKSNWTNFLLAAALAMSMASFVPHNAMAACKNVGGSVGSYKYSSEVKGRSVTVCASALRVTPARTVVVNKKVLVAKPSKTKPKVSAAYKQLMKQLGFVTPKKQSVTSVKKIVKKPKQKIKLVPKASQKKVTKPGTVTNVKGASIFSPSAVSASVRPARTLKIWETANFAVSPTVQFRSGMVNQVPTTVRFTPVDVVWNFKDGTVAQGSSVFHSFMATGIFAVSYSVKFAVAYRVQGKKTWINEPDFISLPGKLPILIADTPMGPNPEISNSPNPRKVLLVGSDCESKPGSFGCK